jgi:hypothetical protein
MHSQPVFASSLPDLWYFFWFERIFGRTYLLDCQTNWNRAEIAIYFPFPSGRDETMAEQQVIRGTDPLQANVLMIHSGAMKLGIKGACTEV